MSAPNCRLRGLVCDDDPVSRRAVTAMMNRHGMVVSEVSTAAEAILLARELRPHAVVVDIALSGSLGLDVVPALLAEAPGAAVVVLSSFQALDTVAVEAGAADVLEKSDLRRLARCLETLPERASARANAGGRRYDARSAPATSPGRSVSGNERTNAASS